MNYTTLPPGRLRRISYSRYLENLRNRRFLQSISISPIRIFLVPRRMDMNISSENYQFSYNRLVDLQDVKIGLLSKNLIEKSKIENRK